MVVGLVITFFFLLLLLHNYSKAIIWIAMTLQFLSYLGTGIGGLKIFNIVVAASILLFFVNKKKISQDPYPKPLVYGSVLFIFSFLITSYSSGWMSLPTVISNIMTYFLFPFLLWKSIKSSKELNLAINIFYYVIAIAIFWGIIEIILRRNVIFEVVESIFVLEDFTINADTIRYGVKRCNSFFSYFSTYGVATFIAFIVFFTKGRWFPDKKHNYVALSILCIIAAFSTGSRAVYLGLFVALLLLLTDRKFIFGKYGVLLFCIVILFSPLFYSICVQIIDSMLYSDKSMYASGSSAELRFDQWGVCEYYFLKSPWVGNGRMYIWNEVSPNNPELLGAESIWFSILVDYGILGALSFICLIIACAVCLFRCNKRLICLPIGYLLILSLSPDQGIQYNILITSTVLLIRLYQFEKSS